jgi:hypothetical protein
MIATHLYGNRLLDARPSPERERMPPGTHIRTLKRWEATNEGGGPFGHVDFPIDAVLSVFAIFVNGDVCEVGTVGCEGFLEADAALDVDTARRPSSCQVAGRVVRMPIETFREELRSSVPFARIVRRNVSARLFTAEQFTACNVKHALLERCARCILMTRDRVGRDEFALTHEVLATMLGVRRASVSVAAEKLQQLGAITYRRGVVAVRDADVLLGSACDCYQSSKHAFERSLRDDDVTFDEELFSGLSLRL